MAWTNEERRASERIELGLACACEMQAPVYQEGVEFHQGMGKVLNMSRGGMLLLLDAHPRIQQRIQVDLFHPRTDQTLSQVQIQWTRPAEDRGQYLAGGKFVFGPYSTSQDRICAPPEFVSPLSRLESQRDAFTHTVPAIGTEESRHG